MNIIWDQEQFNVYIYSKLLSPSESLTLMSKQESISIEFDKDKIVEYEVVIMGVFSVKGDFWIFVINSDHLVESKTPEIGIELYIFIAALMVFFITAISY